MLIIEAEGKGGSYLKELFSYRELFFFLAWRDVIVRYKQAAFGLLWAMIRPVLNMLAFTLIFQRLAHFPSGEVHYPLFVLAGMIPWQVCSNVVGEGCLSLINHSSLISKIYFPRMVIPMAQMVVHLLDGAVSLLLLLLLGIWVGDIEMLHLLFLPPLLLHLIFLSLGASLWLSALTTLYRDIRFLIPFFIQMTLFVSPVGYGTFLLPHGDRFYLLYCLNPLVGLIDGFRWVFFGLSHPMLPYTFAASLAMTCLLFLTGFTYFKRVEKSLVDRM